MCQLGEIRVGPRARHRPAGLWGSGKREGNKGGEQGLISSEVLRRISCDQSEPGSGESVDSDSWKEKGLLKG